MNSWKEFSMDKRTCSIDGCDRVLRARGWCTTHWARWKKHGDPNVGARVTLAECVVEGCARKPTRRDMCTLHYGRWKRHGDPLTFRPDATRGCAVEACSREHYGHGWCALHWARWSKTGDPLALLPHYSPLAGRTGSLNPMWVGDDVGYSGVHARLRKELGPACERDCAHCGAGADDWAYDHGDPDERVSMDGLSYSVKGPWHYIPLCTRCHSRFDRAYARVCRTPSRNKSAA